MDESAKSKHPKWTDELDSLTRSLKNLIQVGRQPPANPFAARAMIDRACEALKMHGLESSIPSEVQQQRKAFDEACTIHAAEFWQRISDECSSAGWELIGTVSRRLFCRGPFIEVSDDTVTIEGSPARFTPFVPEVLEALKALALQLQPQGFKMSEFMEQLAKAYDHLAAPSPEKPIEDVYREWVVITQKPAFWRNLDVKQFTRRSRAVFRAHLSEALRVSQSTRDGRQLRMGTTTQARDVWELYSPGESLVVQMGRLALLPVKNR